MTDFDFGKLYRTVTETIDINDDYTLIVKVGEIPHGEYADFQARMMGEVTLSNDKRAMEHQLQNIKLNPTKFADEKNLLAVKEWSIMKGTGEPVPLPLTMETWRKLPHSVTEKIEKVVAKLNPDLDADFQD